MASSRADEVAEILWELKRAGKCATFSHIARRAGFSAGSNGRAMATCLKSVRRDWPHLHWWRAIQDNGTVEEGQTTLLKEAGYLATDGIKVLDLKEIEVHLMSWEVAVAVAAPEPMVEVEAD